MERSLIFVVSNCAVNVALVFRIVSIFVCSLQAS